MLLKSIKKETIDFSSIELDALGSSENEVFELFKKYSIFYDYTKK